MTEHNSDEALDRGTDIDLREVLAGERAPDQVAAILRRHVERLGRPPVRKRQHLLAACLLLGIGAVVATSLLMEGQDPALPAGPSGDPEQVLDLPAPDGTDPQDPTDPKPEVGPDRVVLENGVTVMLWPVPGTGQVAMETFYEVGFLHEPRGMTQAAHLLEHIMCNGATASWAAGASFALLNEVGMANAETLPTSTHYDYTVPADRLELCLKVASERLSSLRITEELVLQEAPRCYRETDFVERNPQAGMLKFAFMALAQVWRHGRQEALVRGGMEEFAIADLVAFHRAGYRPDRLRVVLIGDFERAAAMALIEEHLGALPRFGGELVGAIDWRKVPARTTVRWDSTTRAVCVAWPPPKNRADCVALSLLGARFHQLAAQDAELQEATDMVNFSNWLWHVGELPFYAYATVAAGADPNKVEAALRRVVAQAVADLHPVGTVLAGQVRGIHGRYRFLDKPYVERLSGMIQRQRPGMESPERQAMVMGQGAINWAVADMAVGGDPEAIAAALAGREGEDLQRMIRGTLAPERALVTHILPMDGK